MIMITVCITVCRHDDLKVVAPELLCQLHANLMRRGSVHLARAKGLIAVKADSTAQLVPIAFGVHELLGCRFNADAP